MNILKNNIKVIVLIIILILISSGVSVFATYNYLASDVNYTDDKTVEQALNELYFMKDNKYSEQEYQLALTTARGCDTKTEYFPATRKHL